MIVSVSVCVCLSACLSVREHISGTTRPIFSNFFVNVTYGRGSVLLWRRCDMLCISGFLGGVIFAHDGPYAGMPVYHWNSQP